MFRKDALNNKKNTWNGKVILLSNIPPFYIYISCSIFVCFILMFILKGTYTRRMNVIGEVSTYPRTSKIFSNVQGIVIEQLASVGQDIKIGDPIYVIDVSKSTQSGILSQNQRKDIESQIERVGKIIIRLESSKRDTLSMLEKQKEKYVTAFQQSSNIILRAQNGVSIMRKNMDNYNLYLKKGLINKDQFINQVSMYYQQQNNLLGLSGQNEQNALQIINIENQINIQSSDFDNQINHMELQLYELQKEILNIDANDKIIIRALSSGKIDSLSVTEGQMVNVGDSLIHIIPFNVDYSIILWVPNDVIPYLSLNDKVNISYDAFPIEKFGKFPGAISEMSKTPASIQEMATYSGAPKNATGASTPYYKIIIKPKYQSIKYKDNELKIETGMKVKSTLFLEERNIYQWMFSPLYDMKSSISGPVYE